MILIANILNTIEETYADGPGIRYSIYFAGCKHNCPHCHNPESWDFNNGIELTDTIINDIYKQIESNPMLTGITISGGDPLYSSKDLLKLLLKIKDLNKNIWVFTGFTIEELIDLNDTDINECLKYIDVLVDGPYKHELRNLSEFKGSTNQRYIYNPYNYIQKRRQ